MIINFDFRKQKISEVFQNKSFHMTKDVKKVLTKYYIDNYDRVRTNIIEDELVGWEYHNLCIIEEIEPKVKQLRVSYR